MSIIDEIKNVESQLTKSPLTKLLKLKHNLLYAYLLNLKLLEKSDADGDKEEIMDTLKELSTLLEKILKIENKINYTEKNRNITGGSAGRSITPDMMKNKSIIDKLKKKGKGAKNKMRRKGDDINEKRKFRDKEVSTKKTRTSKFN